ncbi:hypothetical protein OAD54_01435 [Candidatus Pelagibacter sp.]|nr:hypothetical protein [Candidatus Pelagibacter sp.]
MARDQVFTNMIPLSPETASSEETVSNIDEYGRTLQYTMLIEILRELKIMNMHLASMSDEKVLRDDIELQIGEE